MADTLASGASARKGVEVRLLSWAFYNKIELILLRLVIRPAFLHLYQLFHIPRVFFVAIVNGCSYSPVRTICSVLLRQLASKPFSSRLWQIGQKGNSTP